MIARATLHALSLALLILPVSAEPTAEREWRSSAGTTLTATAMEFTEGVVLLKTPEGRELKLSLDKFAEEDQAFLKEHFGVKEPEPGEPQGSGLAEVTEGLAQPIGEISGPIDAGDGSTYFVYVSKTLRDGRKAPLMFYTGAGGGSAKIVKRFIMGAELNGWIFAASVQSKNGPDHPVKNHEHSKRCVEHLIESLPIDDERVYFSGNSGGGAMSFYNALRIKSQGNMPYIGYSPDKKYDKKQYCLGIGGATDYNRYLTAHAVAEFGDRGFHRLFVGGHSGGPDWIGVEGMAWLNGRFLGDNRKESELDGERLDYESTLIGWIKELQATAPHRAHYWCHFLQEDYEIEGPNGGIVRELAAELAKDPENVRYTEGLYAIDEFSEKFYASEGEGGGSKGKHTSSKIEKAAEKLAEEYSGVPEIEDIARALGGKTVGI